MKPSRMIGAAATVLVAFIGAAAASAYSADPFVQRGLTEAFGAWQVYSIMYLMIFTLMGGATSYAILNEA